jgi:hypothetical protein
MAIKFGLEGLMSLLLGCFLFFGDTNDIEYEAQPESVTTLGQLYMSCLTIRHIFQTVVSVVQFTRCLTYSV